MMLGAASLDGNVLLQVLLAIGLLASVATNVVALFKLNRAQKREVSFSFEPASKKEFDEHVAATRAEFKQLGMDASTRRQFIYNKIATTEGLLMAALGELRRESNAESARLHARINDVLSAVSELRGRLGPHD